ncbi:MAG: tRNA preQ1(34) S-adenosylmethionine ribosyltransferase-isomerase QueA [Bryobacteraceae bacterium]
MRVDEFDYHLPEELIAQEPLADRAASRMLVLYVKEQRWEDRQFRELPQWIRPGDSLIVNDTRVFPSRLYGHRTSGTAAVEVFLLHPLSEDRRTWEALVRPGRKVPIGEVIRFADSLDAEILSRGDHGQRTLRFSGSGDIYEALTKIGHVPLPPYIRRPDTQNDRDRYQTVFARETGSVAAPTAGLHFTPEILEECREAGAALERVTLHVGLGTFQPLHAGDLSEVHLHSERFDVPADALARIENATRRIAVGTTSVRAIESAAKLGPGAGETEIFISPGFQFRYVNALLTNFHLPKSSLLMLVCALAGKDLTMAAYLHAVEQRYRFFSYGDCMLVI